MTVVSKHELSARVPDPAGDIQLTIPPGTPGGITLDAGRIPHVQGEITAAVADPMLLEKLDPRDNRRVVIDVSATFLSEQGLVRTRSFDLGIREATPNRADSTVTLTLASDEALLGDYAQLEDDRTPFDLSSSLRAVVNYVLGKAIPGAVLEASPAIDADLTPYWEVTNLLRNPAVVANLNNWSPGGGCTIAWVQSGSSGEVSVTLTAANGAVFAVDTAKYNIPATPGEQYTFSVAQRFTGAGTGGAAQAILRFLDNNNAIISTVEGPQVPAWPTYQERAEVTAVAPPSAAKVAPYVRFIGVSGRNYRLDAGLLHTSRFPVPPFTGADAPNSGYTYAFEGPPNDSASIRTPDVERDPEAMVWRAGESAMDFLEPLLKVAGFRLVCDEQRRWTLRDTDYRADGGQTYRYGVNIKDADENLSRDDDAWFDAAVYVYKWTDANGIAQTRTDAFSLNPDPTKVFRVELTDTPYPGPGRAESIVRRAQSRGRTVTVSAIPRWDEQTDQPLSVRLDGTPIQTGMSGSVRFDFGTDTVQVTSRTTDTPAAAWILIPVGESWLDSPPGGTWKNEVI